MTELLSPKLDIVFKKLFSEHLDLLKHFVAAMMSISVESITYLELTNTEITPDDVDSKFSRLDLRLWMNKTQIDIEIQIRKFEGFKERALFYWAKMFTSVLKEGDEYLTLPQTISINLLDFNLFEHQTTPHTEIVPVIKNTNEIFSDKMILHFFELRKVVKLKSCNGLNQYDSIPSDQQNNSLSPAMSAWLTFLNSKNEEDLKMFEDNQIIHKATLILRELSGDEKLKEQARMREKRLHDEASELASAREEGRKEGREEGRKEGREEGVTEGRKEGREEGRKEGREEGVTEGRKEGREEGKLTTLFSLVLDGDITVDKAANRAGMNEAEFSHAMAEYKVEKMRECVRHND